jgi:hypothetical protein
MCCVAPESGSPYLSVRTKNFAERCDQMPKLPKHAIYIRWGAFELNIVGRRPITGFGVGIGLLLGLQTILHFVK